MANFGLWGGLRVLGWSVLAIFSSIFFFFLQFRFVCDVLPRCLLVLSVSIFTIHRFVVV